MKIKELFEYVDEVMENVFSDKVKLRWLNQIEAELQVDVLLLQTDGIAQYTEEDLDKGLIAPPPFDELYAEYLLYRICLAQEEPERANNKVATFNRAYHEYARFIAETANPGDGMAELRRYYLRGEQGPQGERGPQGVPGEQGVRAEYDEGTQTLYIIGGGEGGSGGLYTPDETLSVKGAAAEAAAVGKAVKALQDQIDDIEIPEGSAQKGKDGDSFVSLTYNARTGKWMQTVYSDGTFHETIVTGPDVYSKSQIDTMFGSYIDDVAALIGGGAV